MFSALRSLLPRACPGCDRQLGREVGLCSSCRAGLRARLEQHSPLVSGPEPHLVTLGRYTGTVRRAVRALKYGQARDIALPLGQALARGIPAAWAVAAVVPVPLHTSRLRERGYNQAEVLAQVMARELGVPCLPLLTRTRATAQQAKQHAVDRAGNLAGAFAVRGTVPTGTLLLIDDVMTTGSTLLACREALHQAGTTNLKYAVLAR